jgi:hypothetical protein
MSLKVIGSGFGRTGTMSTKLALEQLGFGPCHHMFEVVGNPSQPSQWKSVASGGAVDWIEVFDGYHSQVDWPGAAVWRETAVAFPNAKVVHTERPEDEWWTSFNGTIGKFFTHRTKLPLPPHIADIFRTMADWFLKDTFVDHTDRASCIAAYRRNNEKVRAMIPRERLLVFNVAQGWAPLCHFLGAPAPTTPFPRSNPRDEFWMHFGGEPA